MNRCAPRCFASLAVRVLMAAALCNALWVGAAPNSARGAAPPSARAPAARAPAPPNTFRIPGSFEPLAAVWLGYDAGHAPWTAELVSALSPHVRLHMLVRDQATAQEARITLHDLGAEVNAIRFHLDPQAAFFVQDAALFALDARARLGMVDLQWSDHGLAAWCARRHAADADAAAACARGGQPERGTLGRTIAAFAQAQVIGTPLHLEGGGVEVNGRGVMIANQALLASRNPEFDAAQLQHALLQLPGVRKVVWLPEGLAEDPHLRSTITGDHVGWGTGGHTDQFVRFADARTVLLAWPTDAQAAAHPVARLTRERMQRNLDVLSRALDADGRPFRIVKVPMPHVVERPVVLAAQADTQYSEQWRADDFAPDENRRTGDTVLQVASASYLNYVVANGVVVLPDYLRSGTPPALQQQVRLHFERAFPGRRVVFVDSLNANWYAGGPHCATLSQPAGR